MSKWLLAVAVACSGFGFVLAVIGNGLGAGVAAAGHLIWILPAPIILISAIHLIGASDVLAPQWRSETHPLETYARFPMAILTFAASVAAWITFALTVARLLSLPLWTAPLWAGFAIVGFLAAPVWCGPTKE